MSSTSAIHHPALSTIDAMGTRSHSRRLGHEVRAKSTQARAIPGTMSSTWNCLVRNPRPRQTPARTSQNATVRVVGAVPDLPVWDEVPRCRPLTARSACWVATTAPIIRVTSSASGLLNRNISAATGETANSAPAPNAAAFSIPVPTWERKPILVEWTMSRTLTPARRTCGRSIENEENPKTRALSAMSHSAAGGLSTVIAFAESSEPKRKASQFSVPAWTAAA